ncbi:hypothetical protein [Nonomuraea sp. NPDC050202]|uniref:hypothetical protein n=1 Tax=Nonomuraea sp. NPDC050202 TaxID=3155035 RepID=UPI0033FB2C87
MIYSDQLVVQGQKTGGVAMAAAQPGYRVGGRYRLIAVLGAGGFGRVWRAHDQVLGVEVAVKELQLLPGMSQTEQEKRLERTTREFLVPIAGKTVAVIGGAAAFLAGAGAVFYAFDGIALLLPMMDTRRGDRIWVIPLIVITVVTFLMGGWAWESRKSRRSRRGPAPEPGPASPGRGGRPA